MYKRISLIMVIIFLLILISISITLGCEKKSIKVDFIGSLSGTAYELEKSFSDLQETQNLLIQSEKMAVLGELVTGISHEMRTPLGALITVSTFMDKLLKDFKKQYDTDSISKSSSEKFITKLQESIDLTMANTNRTNDFVNSFTHFLLPLKIEATQDLD